MNLRLLNFARNFALKSEAWIQGKIHRGFERFHPQMQKRALENQSIALTAYRRWGDKTLYLKNVKCSGEPKNMAALTLQ